VKQLQSQRTPLKPQFLVLLITHTSHNAHAKIDDSAVRKWCNFPPHISIY